MGDSKMMRLWAYKLVGIEEDDDEWEYHGCYSDSPEVAALQIVINRIWEIKNAINPCVILTDGTSMWDIDPGVYIAPSIVHADTVGEKLRKTLPWSLLK